MTKINVPNSPTFSQIKTSIQADVSLKDNDELRSKEDSPLYTSDKTISTADARAAIGFTNRLDERAAKFQRAKDFVKQAIAREFGHETAERVADQYYMFRRPEAMTIGELIFIGHAIRDVRLGSMSEAPVWDRKLIPLSGYTGQISDRVALSQLMRDFPEIATDPTFPKGAGRRDQDLLTAAFAVNAVQDAMRLTDDDAQLKVLGDVVNILEERLTETGRALEDKVTHGSSIKEELRHVMTLVSAMISPSEGRRRSQSTATDYDAPSVAPKALWTAYEVSIEDTFATELQDASITLRWTAVPARTILGRKPSVTPQGPQAGP